MDDFLKIGAQELEGKKVQNEKKKNLVDKKRVARLKKSFLPYWAREIEPEAGTGNNLQVNHERNSI